MTIGATSHPFTKCGEFQLMNNFNLKAFIPPSTLAQQKRGTTEGLSGSMEAEKRELWTIHAKTAFSFVEKASKALYTAVKNPAW
jgi:hypothetical protein